MRHPGRAGLTADRLGDAEVWTKRDVTNTGDGPILGPLGSDKVYANEEGDNIQRGVVLGMETVGHGQVQDTVSKD
jgi:hypothetical protein